MAYTCRNHLKASALPANKERCCETPLVCSSSSTSFPPSSPVYTVSFWLLPPPPPPKTSKENLGVNMCIHIKQTNTQTYKSKHQSLKTVGQHLFTQLMLNDNVLPSGQVCADQGLSDEQWEPNTNLHTPEQLLEFSEILCGTGTKP